jgi:hypothetical protein
MGTNEFLQLATKRKNNNSVVSESEIENAFCKFAKSRGCSALKLIFLNKSGFPDRTVICPNGRVLFIEFKKKGKKLSAIQVVVKKMLESYNFSYYTCDEISHAESILDDFINIG